MHRSIGGEPPSDGPHNNELMASHEKKTASCDAGNCALNKTANTHEIPVTLTRVKELSDIAHPISLNFFATGVRERLISTIGEKEYELVKLSLRALHEAKSQTNSHPTTIGSISFEVTKTLDHVVRLRFIYLGRNKQGLPRYYYTEAIARKKPWTTKRYLGRFTALLRRYRVVLLLLAASLAAMDQIVQHSLSIYNEIKPYLTWGAIVSGFIASLTVLSDD